MNSYRILHFGLAAAALLFAASCAKKDAEGPKADGSLDRTVLPIHEPAPVAISELDARNAKALYAERRIPGAVFFDIDEIADTDSDLPHMLPAPEKFAARMRKLGVGDGARIVVYDNHGLFSAPRVWWSFRAMGHEDVVVLDGGEDPDTFIRRKGAEGDET